MNEEDKIFFGYTISFEHHRKGYAFEALRGLTELLHKKYPCSRFYCLVHNNNIASIELLKKLGYRYKQKDLKKNLDLYEKL